MDQNNHEIFSQLRDTSDGKGADGVQHPDLRAKADATAVNIPQIDEAKARAKVESTGKSADSVISVGKNKDLYPALDKWDDAKEAYAKVKGKTNIGRGKSIIDRD